MAEQNCYPLPYGCDECYSLSLPYNITLTVGAGLTPASTVNVVLTAMNGNQWESDVVVNGDGSVTIDTTGYPEGMFNQYAGQFDITIYNSTGYYNEVIPVTIDGKEYSCMKLIVECE